MRKSFGLFFAIVLYIIILFSFSSLAKFVLVTGETANIRTMPSNDSVIIGQALENDIFVYVSEEYEWIKINLFSSEPRYIHQSLISVSNKSVLAPFSNDDCIKLMEKFREIEDKSLTESNKKYPLTNSINLENNSEYQKILFDRYLLDVFHQYKLQPVLYPVVISRCSGDLKSKIGKSPTGIGENKKVSELTEKKSSTSSSTLERKVKEIAVETFGKTVNWESKPSTILGIEKSEQTSGGYRIELEYRASDNFSAGMIKRGIFIDAIDFYKRIFQEPSCRDIKICMLRSFFILVDEYGNKKEEPVAKLTLRRDIADKINWENITSDMFERLLIKENQLWLHPAFNK